MDENGPEVGQISKKSSYTMASSATDFLAIHSQLLEEPYLEDQMTSSYLLEQDDLLHNLSIDDTIFDEICADDWAEGCDEHIMPPQTKRAKLDPNLGPLFKVGIQNEIPSRSSNASNDYYAHCIKDKLVVGMSVRCRQSVQKLNINDTGIVTQIKLQNGLHDYNVEVLWNGKDNYWMRYIEIELLSVSASIPQLTTLQTMFHTSQSVEPNLDSHALGSSNQLSQFLDNKAMQNCIDGLVHVTHCRDPFCNNQWCPRMKNLLIHSQSCPPSIEPDKKCPICYQLFIICQNHVKQCTVTSNCPVYLCDFLKKNLHRTEHSALGRAPTAPLFRPNPLILAVKIICKTLESPQLTAGDHQRIIQIMSSLPQLAEIFNSQRNVLQLQLNQNQGDLSDLRRKQICNQIEQIDRIFSVLEVGSQPAITTQSVPLNKSTLLSTLKKTSRSISAPLVTASLPSDSANPEDVLDLPSKGNSRFVAMDTSFSDHSLSSSFPRQNNSNVSIPRPHRTAKLIELNSVITNCSLNGPAKTNCEPNSCSKWTPAMVEFYDKDDADVDFEEITQSMPTDKQHWAAVEDEFVVDRRTRNYHRRKICQHCKHPYDVNCDCPTATMLSTCVICGVSGHRFKFCPKLICLGCGKPSSELFARSCSQCYREERSKCEICGLDHFPTQCPDSWRRYHSTVTNENLPDGSPPPIKATALLSCCNCTERGHVSFDCPKLWKTNLYPHAPPRVFSYQEPIESLNLVTDPSTHSIEKTALVSLPNRKVEEIPASDDRRRPVWKLTSMKKNGLRLSCHIDYAPNKEWIKQLTSTVRMEIANVIINNWTHGDEFIVGFTGKGNITAARIRFEHLMSPPIVVASASPPIRIAPTASSSSSNGSGNKDDPQPIKSVDFWYETEGNTFLKRATINTNLNVEGKKKVTTRIQELEALHSVQLKELPVDNSTKWELKFVSGMVNEVKEFLKKILQFLKDLRK